MVKPRVWWWGGSGIQASPTKRLTLQNVQLRQPRVFTATSHCSFLTMCVGNGSQPADSVGTRHGVLTPGWCQIYPDGCCVSPPCTAGATYPADKVAEQYALTGDGGASKTSASMDGEQPGPKTHRRALLNGARNVPFSAVTSGIVGLAPVSRAA